MAGDKLSFRAWLPFAIIALVVLGGATILCGLVGMMALTRSGTTSSSPATGGTAAAPLISPSSPTPVPSLLPPIKPGRTYRACIPVTCLTVTVLEIGDGGWIRANIQEEGTGWLNLNQVWFIRELSP